MSERLLFSELRGAFLNSPTKKMGKAVYMIAWLSFVPVLGLLFGIVAISLGLCLKRIGRFKVIGIGFAGVFFTVGLASFLTNYAFQGTFIRSKLTQIVLDNIQENIEKYKVTYGEYPDSLEDLKKTPSDGAAEFTYDLMDIKGKFSPRRLYFKKVDNTHYYLRSSGVDGIPFTPDDMTPQLSSSQQPSGLLIQKN